MGVCVGKLALHMDLSAPAVSVSLRPYGRGRRACCSGLLVSACSCVWCRAVGSTGRHWSAFPQRILTTTRLVGRTCLACIALVVFDGLHGSSITPIKISALFRSGWGDVIAIPCGSLVLTASPVGTARIWKCFALYFNIHIG